ncbi:major facilitator superfamily transporter [Fusarium sp. NRRL 52700]|nr:major facilitator superfamily transporter [Fusarium sp. NRRL 52700]
MDPGSFGGPPLPIPEDMETNHTFKAPWHIGKGKANSGSLGIWANFFQAVGATAESNFDWHNANDVSHICETLDTYSIEPTDDYVKESEGNGSMEDGRDKLEVIVSAEVGHLSGSSRARINVWSDIDGLILGNDRFVLEEFGH